jgi:hypothetical protein
MSLNGNNGPGSTPIHSMKMAEHLSDAEIEEFRRSSMDAAKLVFVSDHIVECETCRRRVMPASVLAAKLGHLQRNLVRHLTDEELTAWTDGEDVEDPAFVEAHLERCHSCRRELSDLHVFQQKLKPAAKQQKAMFAWAAVAAAAVLVVVAVVGRKPASAPRSASNRPAATRPAEIPLSPRTVERAAVLEELFRPEGQLLGEEGKRVYHALSPVGIVTMSDHPAFRWEAIPGATNYVVSIYDKEFRKVVESPKLNANNWTSTGPLPRGSRLSWQVSATVTGKSVRLPIPPAREAVFEVMNAEAAKAISDARDLRHAPPVELGLLYARAGALEDAEAEFSKTPDAKDLLESVRKLLQQQTR